MVWTGIDAAVSKMKDKPSSALAAILIMLGFVAWHTMVAFSDPFVENSDQVNIGLMVLKTSSPALFPRDYVFSDPQLFAFYTPAYIAFVGFLNGLTGSYDMSMALLVPVVALIYVSGMFALVLYLTGSIWLGVFVAVISAIPQWTIGATFWGVVGLGAMVPRALYTMCLPWLFLACFALLMRDEGWRVASVALAGGLLANVHPVTGFHFIQLLLSFWFVLRPKSLALVAELSISCLAAFVGALPVLLNFLQGTKPYSGTGMDFHQFYIILQQRLATLFPFAPFDFFGYSVGAAAQEWLLWSYLIGGLLWCAGAGWLWFRGPGSGRAWRVMFGVFVIINVLAAYLLLGFHKGGLILLALTYAGLFLVRVSPTRCDWAIASLLGLSICYSFVAAYVLGKCLLAFEWASMTSLVGEQSRLAEFVYLPLYLMGARCLQEVVAGVSPIRWKVLAVIVLSVCAIFAVRRDIFPNPWGRQHTIRAKDRALRQDLYAWANAQTPIDALFYHDSLEFRFRAQRSITHCWKDLGFVYYSGRGLVAFYQRFREFASGYADERALIHNATKAGVDYVILEGRSTLSPDLPLAFANAAFRVYKCCAASRTRPE